MSLKKWVKERWVDIGAPKKDGKYQPCGRAKGSKRKYPKCVPIAKARKMTPAQIKSAVSRKEQHLIQDQNQQMLQRLKRKGGHNGICSKSIFTT